MKTEKTKYRIVEHDWGYQVEERKYLFGIKCFDYWKVICEHKVNCGSGWYRYTTVFYNYNDARTALEKWKNGENEPESKVVYEE